MPLSRASSSHGAASSTHHNNIHNTELIEYSQTQQLNEWTIPSISHKRIYKKGLFQFISKDHIKTVERGGPRLVVYM